MFFDTLMKYSWGEPIATETPAEMRHFVLQSKDAMIAAGRHVYHGESNKIMTVEEYLALTA